MRQEPVIEKWPHPHGVEYAWVLGDRVLGSVVPHGSTPDQAERRKQWKALAGHRTVGIFTGRNGRFAAMRAVQHLTWPAWRGVQA